MNKVPYLVYPHYDANFSNTKEDERIWKIELTLEQDPNLFLASFFKQIPFYLSPDWNTIIDALVVEEIEGSYDVLELVLFTKTESSAKSLLYLMNIFSLLDAHYDDKDFLIKLVETEVSADSEEQPNIDLDRSNSNSVFKIEREV